MKQKNTLYNHFQNSINQIKNLKNYLIFSTSLFIFISLFGILFPVFFQEEIIKIIQEIVKQTQGLGPLELIAFIMFNNMKSAFFSIILGIFFAIMPITITIVNAYVLGFVINKTILTEGPFIIWKLLPHGIFEIPAILISVSLGIHLGLFLFTNKEKNKLNTFIKTLKQSLITFLLIIIPLLVIAGIIEGGLIWLLS